MYGGSIAVERQKYDPVMDWLSAYAERDAVVFGNDEVSHLVTIYTPQNVFFHRGVPATTLGASDERLLEILFTYYRLRGVTASEAQEIFFTLMRWRALPSLQKQPSILLFAGIA